MSPGKVPEQLQSCSWNEPNEWGTNECPAQPVPAQPFSYGTSFTPSPLWGH